MSLYLGEAVKWKGYKMPKVVIPSPLRKYANDRREVLVDGDSLRETMDRLFEEYPGFKRIDYDPALVSIFVNRRMIRTEANRWDTFRVQSDDEITLILPIAGG